MKTDKEGLYAALAQYGYPLLEPGAKADPNRLMAELVRAKDARLLEGFPVALAGILSQEPGKFSPVSVEGRLKTPALKKRFQRLLELSLALFELFGMQYPRMRSLHAKDPAERDEVRNALQGNRPLKLEGARLDLERVKKTFRNYMVHARSPEGLGAEDRLKLKAELRQEYLLSLLLSPKQKELAFKKMKGEAMNKTEREYFSRVVKKRLQAMADPDLHHLAQKALQGT